MSAGSRLAQTLRHSEQQLIEQALMDSNGRVAGFRGAAARLGVPASTLESKIRRYRIDKLRFRTRRN
jgi:formate hydrogenlyase transcriptional activator